MGIFQSKPSATEAKQHDNCASKTIPDNDASIKQHNGSIDCHNATSAQVPIPKSNTSSLKKSPCASPTSVRKVNFAAEEARLIEKDLFLKLASKPLSAQSFSGVSGHRSVVRLGGVNQANSFDRADFRNSAPPGSPVTVFKIPLRVSRLYPVDDVETASSEDECSLTANAFRRNDRFDRIQAVADAKLSDSPEKPSDGFSGASGRMSGVGAAHGIDSSGLATKLTVAIDDPLTMSKGVKSSQAEDLPLVVDPSHKRAISLPRGPLRLELVNPGVPTEGQTPQIVALYPTKFAAGAEAQDYARRMTLRQERSYEDMVREDSKNVKTRTRSEDSRLRRTVVTASVSRTEPTPRQMGSDRMKHELPKQSTVSDSYRSQIKPIPISPKPEPTHDITNTNNNSSEAHLVTSRSIVSLHPVSPTEDAESTQYYRQIDFRQSDSSTTKPPRLVAAHRGQSLDRSLESQRRREDLFSSGNSAKMVTATSLVALHPVSARMESESSDYFRRIDLRQERSYQDMLAAGSIETLTGVAGNHTRVHGVNVVKRTAERIHPDVSNIITKDTKTTKTAKTHQPQDDSMTYYRQIACRDTPVPAVKEVSKTRSILKKNSGVYKEPRGSSLPASEEHNVDFFRKIVVREDPIMTTKNEKALPKVTKDVILPPEDPKIVTRRLTTRTTSMVNLPKAATHSVESWETNFYRRMDLRQEPASVNLDGIPLSRGRAASADNIRESDTSNSSSVYRSSMNVIDTGEQRRSVGPVDGSGKARDKKEFDHKGMFRMTKSVHSSSPAPPRFDSTRNIDTSKSVKQMTSETKETQVAKVPQDRTESDESGYFRMTKTVHNSSPASHVDITRKVDTSKSLLKHMSSDGNTPVVTKPPQNRAETDESGYFRMTRTVHNSSPAPHVDRTRKVDTSKSSHKHISSEDNKSELGKGSQDRAEGNEAGYFRMTKTVHSSSPAPYGDNTRKTDTSKSSMKSVGVNARKDSAETDEVGYFRMTKTVHRSTPAPRVDSTRKFETSRLSDKHMYSKSKSVEAPKNHAETDQTGYFRMTKTVHNSSPAPIVHNTLKIDTSNRSHEPNHSTDQQTTTERQQHNSGSSNYSNRFNTGMKSEKTGETNESGIFRMTKTVHSNSPSPYLPPKNKFHRSLHGSILQEHRPGPARGETPPQRTNQPIVDIEKYANEPVCSVRSRFSQVMFPSVAALVKRTESAGTDYYRSIELRQRSASTTDLTNTRPPQPSTIIDQQQQQQQQPQQQQQSSTSIRPMERLNRVLTKSIDNLVSHLPGHRHQLGRRGSVSQVYEAPKSTPPASPFVVTRRGSSPQQLFTSNFKLLSKSRKSQSKINSSTLKHQSSSPMTTPDGIQQVLEVLEPPRSTPPASPMLSRRGSSPRPFFASNVKTPSVGRNLLRVSSGQAHGTPPVSPRLAKRPLVVEPDPKPKGQGCCSTSVNTEAKPGGFYREMHGSVDSLDKIGREVGQSVKDAAGRHRRLAEKGAFPWKASLGGAVIM